MPALRITLTGPCSPADVSGLLDECHRDETQTLVGRRAVAVSTLAKELVQLGHVVSVVTSADEVAGTPKLFSGPNFSLRVVPRRRRFRDRALDFYRAERRFLRAEIIKTDPDIVHSHWTNEYSLAALKTTYPVLVTARDAPVTIFFKYSFSFHGLLQLLLGIRVRMKVNNLSAVSTYLANQWRKEMLWHRRVPVIPNGSPMNIVSPSDDEAKQRIVVALGDASKRKNIRSLIRAWPLILKHFPDAQLHVCGADLDPFGALAQEFLGSDKYQNIIWHGFVERNQLEEMLSNCMIQVHPSREESLCNALLEGMAKGLAIVAGKDSGAIPEVAGDSALLVDVNKPEDIAIAVVRLFNEPQLRRQLGQQANRRVLEHFTPRVMANRYVDEYQKVLNLSPRL